MTELVTCIGRLLLEEETLFNVFSRKRNIKELIIEFDDQPRCYSQNFGHKRKYHMTRTQNSEYPEWIVSNTCYNQITFLHPKQSGSLYIMKFGLSHDKFKILGVKAVASDGNCEFVNKKGEMCLQTIMSSSRNIFSVTYDSTILSPEDVVDICGQVITYSDIN